MIIINTLKLRRYNFVTLMFSISILLGILYVLLLFGSNNFMEFNADQASVMAQYKSAISTSKENIYNVIDVINTNEESERVTGSISLDGIVYNQAYSASWVDLTNESIKYIYRYQSAEVMGNQDWSPLFMMSIMTQEMGSNRTVDSTKCLIGSIPTAFMDGSQITLNSIAEIGYSDYIKLGAYDSDPYRGPMQMSETWGSNVGTLPNELSNKTEAQKCDEAGIASPNYTRSGKNYGDRCNWPDICNMFGGYYKDSVKTLEYSSKYELLAVVGLAHNIGKSVITSDTRKPNQDKFCWSNTKECRKWASSFSNQSTVAKIKTDTHKWLETKRNKGVVYVNVRSFADDNKEYAKELMSEGFLEKESPRSWEAIDYAVYIVAYYMIYEEILAGV